MNFNEMRVIRNILWTTTIALCLSCKNGFGEPEGPLSLTSFKEIDSLINVKSFFDARRKFEESKSILLKKDSIYLSAQLNSVFNNLETSNILIGRLFSEFGQNISDSLERGLLGVEYVNYAKLHKYKKAHDIGEKLLEEYDSFLGPDEQEGYANTNAIWEPLKNVAAQTISKSADTEFTMSRDKANLKNLPVKVGDITMDFIFDTGANISTTVKSTAEKLSMHSIPASIQVGSITGEQVEASLAVCDTLRLGNMTLANVIFLVFPDEALYVPSIDFQINGILGYPVIEAMGEVTITKMDAFVVPQHPTKKSGGNMALDFLTPIIELQDKSGVRLPYAFDTGATTSMLYPRYFKRFRENIEDHYEPTEFEFGGAGGSIKKKGFLVPFDVVINDKSVKLDSIELIAKDTAKAFQHLYGNLGQDLINQFGGFTINFESMYIDFE
nr:pepsin/retropepsin-like aspartic protease family protein [Allomuricauda sp.]